MKLTEAMEVGFRDPRVSAYSIIARTILEYKDRTEFRFVPGDYVSTILEEAFRSAHTELCEAIEKTVQSDPKWQELLKSEERPVSLSARAFLLEISRGLRYRSSGWMEDGGGPGTWREGLLDPQDRKASFPSQFDNLH